MSETETTAPEYDRDLQTALEDCSVWSNGCVYLDREAVREHGLTPGTVLDVQIRFDGNAVPLSDAEVVSSGGDAVIRITKRVRERYGIPTGTGASVDVVVQGVIVDA